MGIKTMQTMHRILFTLDMSSLAGASWEVLPLLAACVEHLGPAFDGVAVAAVISEGRVAWRVACVNDANCHAFACIDRVQVHLTCLV
jgi:hypothetical protein